MGSFRPRKSPLADRLLESADTLATLSKDHAYGDVGGELDERDMFSISSGFSSNSNSNSCASTKVILRTGSYPSSSSAISPTNMLKGASFEKNFGILAAFSEEELKKRCFRHASLSRNKSSVSTFGSSTSSARMMIPKSKISKSGGGEMVWQQSAPVKIPQMGRRECERWLEVDIGDGDGNTEDEKMVPPHEIVTRESEKGSPMTTFSMLEGIGRTLKGRDLRRVRNAVWRKTGFLD